MAVTIQREDHRSLEATSLLEELSKALAAITGSSGRSSFSLEDLDNPRAVFAMARDEAGKAIGCGAIRPIGETTAEVKRMYARQKGRAVGTLLLSFLEEQARVLGYASLVLETRRVNHVAVGFYLARGYRVIANYGKYVGREEAVCFEKAL